MPPRLHTRNGNIDALPKQLIEFGNAVPHRVMRFSVRSALAFHHTRCRSHRPKSGMPRKRKFKVLT